MGKVMLMRKVTRIADMEGEKDQAVQLLSHEPLSAILVVSVGCRKCGRWFDFTESLNDSVVHLSAGRYLPAAIRRSRVQASLRDSTPVQANTKNITEGIRTRV